MPDRPGGVKAKACVTMDACKDITGITLVNAGSGYSKAPNVVIRDGTQFNLLNRQQFTAGQTCSVNRNCFLLMRVSTLNPCRMVDQGPSMQLILQPQWQRFELIASDWTPSVRVIQLFLTVAIKESAIGGTGSGALATAVLDVGAVTSVVVTAPGSGYITAGGIKKFQDTLG